METIKFKTNIKCSGCVEKVGPLLNELTGENNWEVDLESPDRILSVNNNDIEVEKIIEAIKKLGYTIQQQIH